MNFFRLSGDLSHLVAIGILLAKMWTSRSVSGKTGNYSHQYCWHSSLSTSVLSKIIMDNELFWWWWWWWWWCAGISGKSQILFAMVFVTRYLDLFTTFISVYNSTMKTVYIVGTFFTIYLIYMKFKATYDGNNDTFRMEFLVVPIAGLSCLVNHEFAVMEVREITNKNKSSAKLLPVYLLLVMYLFAWF